MALASHVGRGDLIIVNMESGFIQKKVTSEGHNGLFPFRKMPISGLIAQQVA